MRRPERVGLFAREWRAPRGGFRAAMLKQRRHQGAEVMGARCRRQCPRRAPPVTFFVVPHRGATVAKFGMTSCPCLSNDPGVVSPSLVASMDRHRDRAACVSAPGRSLRNVGAGCRRRIGDRPERNERHASWTRPTPCSAASTWAKVNTTPSHSIAPAPACSTRPCPTTRRSCGPCSVAWPNTARCW